MSPELSGEGQVPEDPILSAMKDIASEILGADSALAISPDARFKEDLDLDSLGMVELVMELEARFDISIAEEDLVNVLTIHQAIEMIRKKLPPEEDGNDEDSGTEVNEPRSPSPTSGSDAVATEVE